MELRKVKCGMTLIGRSVKPHDRCHSAYYRNDITTGTVVKCRPAMRKMQAMKQECIDLTHFKHSANVFTPYRRTTRCHDNVQ